MENREEKERTTHTREIERTCQERGAEKIIQVKNEKYTKKRGGEIVVKSGGNELTKLILGDSGCSFANGKYTPRCTVVMSSSTTQT